MCNIFDSIHLGWNVEARISNSMGEQAWNACNVFTIHSILSARYIYIPCTFSVICSADEIEITCFMSCTLETCIRPQMDIINDIYVHVDVDSTCICNSC